MQPLPPHYMWCIDSLNWTYCSSWNMCVEWPCTADYRWMIGHYHLRNLCSLDRSISGYIYDRCLSTTADRASNAVKLLGRLLDQLLSQLKEPAAETSDSPGSVWSSVIDFLSPEAYQYISLCLMQSVCPTINPERIHNIHLLWSHVCISCTVCAHTQM